MFLASHSCHRWFKSLHKITIIDKLILYSCLLGNVPARLHAKMFQCLGAAFIFSLSYNQQNVKLTKLQQSFDCEDNRTVIGWGVNDKAQN